MQQEHYGSIMTKTTSKAGMLEAVNKSATADQEASKRIDT
jgi:hypothetical protein